MNKPIKKNKTAAPVMVQQPEQSIEQLEIEAAALEEKKMASFKRQLNAKIDAANVAKTSFIAEFHENACYALDWSQSLFDKVAEAQIATKILNAMEKNQSLGLKWFYEFAVSQALQYARSPHRSTSNTANLMHQAQTTAWANVVEMLRWKMEW